jgi:hypothetical protein
MMYNNNHLIINLCHIKYTLSYTWMYLSMFHFENFVYNYILGNQNHNYGTFSYCSTHRYQTHTFFVVLICNIFYCEPAKNYPNMLL